MLGSLMLMPLFWIPLVYPAEMGNQKLADIAKERITASKKAYDVTLSAAKMDARFHDLRLYLLSKQLLDLELFLENTKEGRIKAYQSHLQRMASFEEYSITMSIDRKGQDYISLTFRSFRLEAEFWLEKAKTQESK